MRGSLPRALAELVSQLEAMGFAVVSEESPSWMWREITLRNEKRESGRGVKLWQDRGIWGASVEAAGRCHELYDVFLALEDRSRGSRAMNHEERRDFTLDVLGRMPAPGAELDALAQRLRGVRR